MSGVGAGGLLAGPERSDGGVDLDFHRLGLGFGGSASCGSLGFGLHAPRLGFGRGRDSLDIGAGPRFDELSLAGPLGGRGPCS